MLGVLSVLGGAFLGVQILDKCHRRGRWNKCISGGSIHHKKESIGMSI